MHEEVTLTFVQSLTSFDWVFRGSTNPGKLSSLLLGHSLAHQKSSPAEKASLILKLQEVCNNKSSKISISSLISCNYSETRKCTDLLIMIGATVTAFTIFTCEFSILVLQLEKFKLHVEKCDICYEMDFTKDHEV